MTSSSISSQWSTMSMPSSSAIMMARLLTRWPRINASRSWAVSMAAAELGAGHLDPVLRRGGAVPTGHEELDDLGAALDLLAHAESERLGAVAQPYRAGGVLVPVPRHAVVAVAGGATARATTARTAGRGPVRPRWRAGRRARRGASRRRRPLPCTPAPTRWRGSAPRSAPGTRAGTRRRTACSAAIPARGTWRGSGR